MAGLQGFIQKNSMYRLFEPYIPGDHHRRITAEDLALPLLARGTFLQVLDLGCGSGATRALFTSLNPRCRWQGAEVAGSPELAAAAGTRDGIALFDGINLPWDNDFFDLVYCHQVLEHVRRPDDLMAEVRRVLRPGGTLVGSVSYLEPYHSLSLFNFTPYGILTVLNDAGLRLEELRPGPDCCSFVLRQLVAGHAGLSRLVQALSPLRLGLDLAATLFRLDHKTRNFLNLQFAGHLVFRACRDKAAA